MMKQGFQAVSTRMILENFDYLPTSGRFSKGVIRLLFSRDPRELAVQVSADVSRYVYEHEHGVNRQDKQLRTLQKGRCIWNKTRQDNIGSAPDLAGFNLKGLNLTSYDLSHAKLGGVNLVGADLRRANLSHAELQQTDMRAAKLGETLLIDVDLSQTAGLGFCEHIGPSILDERTLRKSYPLPIQFLRGVGLSDMYIEYMPALLGLGIEFHTCFISYCSADEHFVRKLHGDLTASGVNCWIASEKLATGAKILDALDREIISCDKMILVLSRNSIISDWVEGEVTHALDVERDRKQLVLMPIRIDDAIFQTKEAWVRLISGQRNVADFNRWRDATAYSKSLERLLRDLRSEKRQ